MKNLASGAPAKATVLKITGELPAAVIRTCVASIGAAPPTTNSPSTPGFCRAMTAGLPPAESM
jgi:hypothetical protein